MAATFTAKADYISPRTYSATNCYKGQVIQINSVVSASASPAIVEWFDTLPLSQSECEAAWMGGYAFKRNSSGVYEAVDFRTWNGVWENVGREFCTLQMPLLMDTDGTYRFAVSARTSQSSSAPTRSFRLTTNNAFAP